MNSPMFVLLLSASVFVAVFSESCNHDNPDQCNLVCSNANEVVGCQHNICTCVPAPQACITAADCSTAAPCDKHDESNHCVDGACKCQKP